MKRISLEEFIEQRIVENKDLFTMEELEFMKKNRKYINKIYLLGAINSKDCYEND